MILSDLMGLRVLDHRGSDLGVVIDARFVATGRTRKPLAKVSLRGIIVSPRSGASFLGYERSEVKAPWAIASFLRWRHRGSFLVDWEHIARIGEDAVTLRAGFQKVDPAT